MGRTNTPCKKQHVDYLYSILLKPKLKISTYESEIVTLQVGYRLQRMAIGRKTRNSRRYINGVQLLLPAYRKDHHKSFFLKDKPGISLAVKPMEIPGFIFVVPVRLI
jgi:hypothetical protein